MGQPDPVKSAPAVRGTFGRMHMNDTETVALIGGGHAFGKTHGACASPPCGTGKGADAVTAGFEGPWTTTPTTWSNGYFTNLLANEWEKHVGPGGHWQWKPAGSALKAPAPFEDPAKFPEGTQDVMMLTSDVSLTKDPSYLAIAKTFAASPEALDVAFSHAWYKLMSRDMGPHARCIGDLVPPPQPFQLALPPAPAAGSYDVAAASAAIRSSIDKSPYNAALFSRAALGCATSFRQTDYNGGCNGALIRFEQSHKLERNAPLFLAKSIATLAPIKEQFGAGLPWADLIVLSGHVAIETVLGEALPPFCPGRADAPAFPTEVLQPAHPAYNFKEVKDAKETQTLLGLTTREFVALSGLLHAMTMPSAGDIAAECEGFLHNVAHMYGERCQLASVGQAYFKNLLSGGAAGDGVITGEAALLEDATYKSVVQEFGAADGQPLFVDAVVSAWMKLANADRFDGPLKNACDAPAAPTAAALRSEPSPAVATTSPYAAVGFGLTTFAIGLAVGKLGRGSNPVAVPMQ